jgi:predicted transcriptional regulator
MKLRKKLNLTQKELVDLAGTSQPARDWEGGYSIKHKLLVLKIWYLPLVAQKMSILFGEHVVNDVLLKLSHQQFVFTFPTVISKKIFFSSSFMPAP